MTTKTEREIRASMTSEQIQLERKLTCEAIEGTMTFGYQNTNPPPNDDHWLGPYWTIGRKLAELDAAMSDLTRLYDVFGLDAEARSVGVLLENVRNSYRRAQCLSLIERFFTKEVLADDPEEEGDTVEDCPLNWGASPEQYIEQFKGAISALATEGGEEMPVAKVRVTHEGYGMVLHTYAAYALPEGIHDVYAAPQSQVDSGERALKADRDLVARASRIMSAVDTYLVRPDGGNRHALRSIIMDEFEEIASPQSQGEKAVASEDARDAERYRWLRKQHWNDADMAVVCQPKQSVKLGVDCPSGERLDNAIDDAIGAERGL